MTDHEQVTPILEMRQISKVYGNGVYANQQVSLSVNRGEIHALVGENGAGKSTLMKILFGMEKPDQGEIVLEGKTVTFRSPQDAIARGIGMVHQHFKLVDSLSVTENVTMGYEPVKRGFIDRKTAKEKVSKIAELFELQDELDTATGKLPVGIKQKVEIIKALYRGAQILILDEPTAVLREVKQISNRISIMRQGKMIDTVDTDGITEQEISSRMVGTNYSKNLAKKAAEPKEVLLQVKNLTAVGMNKKEVVNNVSFSVRAGEITGIAGVEGNGQNELIQMITGLRKIDRGSVCIMGRDTGKLSIQELRELGMSYIPSDRMEDGLAVSMSIGENLISTKLKDRRLYRHHLLSKKKIRDMANQLVRDYRIKCDSQETPVSMLSGGNMQKVVVAREFTQQARLIIAEQPTRGIDVGAAKFIHEELIRLRDENCAVLLVTADLEELYQLSDNILVMYDGRFSAYFPNPDQVSETELGNYMLGVKIQSETEIGRGCHEEEKPAV
ncbi:ABC transporter ATP-binding protein [Diplocloster agilis]|uniref:ABC transporter ATP-binding protein n=1 Tax=Diplocloster agilis TaxID=2850323 RepID=UPI00082304AF|nr:ABC transporter ATP-binding protein [Suonthocola fibrivorans]MCU6734012.1 ABC transporter ATP-binding protein [Suonthocola fibrivorans]SCJ19306.1 Ribose import ATP-binding protein RbsA [uncultured Clostridium sp.]